MAESLVKLNVAAGYSIKVEYDLGHRVIYLVDGKSPSLVYGHLRQLIPGEIFVAEATEDSVFGIFKEAIV